MANAWIEKTLPWLGPAPAAEAPVPEAEADPDEIPLLSEEDSARYAAAPRGTAVVAAPRVARY